MGAGLEPYCEQMASEIARMISPNNAVNYDLVKLYDRTASRGNLFTDEKYGYASFAKITDVRRSDLQGVFNYFSNLGAEQEFREMLVIDSLCFNQDRHSGNFGVLFDNDTLEIVKMSPVFDLNISLLPCVMEEEFLNIGDELFEYAPKLGHDFTRIGQMGMNDVLCIIENSSYSIIVNFLNGKMSVEQNAKPISLKELQENNQNFYNIFKEVCSELEMYMREVGSDQFSEFFLSHNDSTVYFD